ncbi:allophanate hydrolase subunit 2-domain-containing protein [Nemania sp. FL0031]|nr:allophanate hydrolase subunit 2-domain-containing protein [Nemania sp. FL0031]
MLDECRGPAVEELLGNSSTDLPLYGVPFAVKDNIDAKTFRTTAACSTFNPDPAVEDATKGVVPACRSLDYAFVFALTVDDAEIPEHSFDGLFVPTSPTFPIIEEVANDPMQANSILGTYANFVDFLDWSALSIPAGYRSDGLPFEQSLLHMALVGAHLRGFPLNKNLTSRGGVFHQLTATSSSYRLFALADSKPREPELRRVLAGEEGHEIEVEIWHLPKTCFGEFLATIPFPLGIEQIELTHHTWANGFVCDFSALQNALDITEIGDWRAYINSITQPLPEPPMRRSITSVLIANRGEIAFRILKTLRQMKIKTVTIYADQDASTPHVRHADLALRLEGNTVANTYLNAEQIVKIAKAANVDAVIPGYGFLSENADFARLIEEQGMIWIGPTPDQMSDLGLKHSARAIAQRASVPTLPGSPLIASLEHAILEAERIGFPLMLKSTAGGGGIGLRQCTDMISLEEAFNSVRRLAIANFANNGVFLERLISNARHVEVQILGDGTGQRRHQKVLEESPALMVPSDVRVQMRSAVIRLASAVKYRNVGTVEFIYDVDSHNFYFLEVNTRLQVEHPVTEGVTAAQDYVVTKGVSVESFKPCSGRISRLVFPEDVRIDSWIEMGAELIATGKDRQEAIEKLRRGLGGIVIEGIVDSDTAQSGSYTTKTLDAFRFVSPCVEILRPGGHMTVQDYPGRTGLWSKGIPPSGPMDSVSFRLANQLVGNKEHVAAFECTMNGPSIKFHCNTIVAVTGGLCNVQIDGFTIPMHQAVPIQAGQTLSCGVLESGYRIYIAVKATFELANLGGFHGRRLDATDVVYFKTFSGLTSQNSKSGTGVPIPLQPNTIWTIGVIPGPQGAPDIFAPEGLQALFDAEWDVHYNSNRLGIRLRGVRPMWARPNGGEAGLHPSNIHDAPYSIGSISFTGDEAIVLSVDGPSLGGFAVFCVVASAELWKLGQVQPGDKIKLLPMTVKTALELEKLIEHHLTNLTVPDLLERAIKLEEPHATESFSCVIGEFNHRNTKVLARQAGDRAMLIELGEEENGFQISHSLEIITFMNQHRIHPILGVEELTPGVRSLHVKYAPQTEPQIIYSRLLAHAESYDLPTTIASRNVHLPFAFDDKVSQAAVDRYSATIRAEAPWLPSNVKFLETLNGIDKLEEVFPRSTFLVLGLGDVYLGSPCAVSLDPRHRLFGTKYNPSRSHTPRGSVGLGGQYLCIYAMESPGGYQLVGRTTNIWNPEHIFKESFKEHTNHDPASTEVPWLIRLFDRITFYPISESDMDGKPSHELIQISEGEFDVLEYNAWVARHQDDILQTAELRAACRDSAPFIEDLMKPYDLSTQVLAVDNSEQHGESVRAPMPGRCWKVLVTKGSEVKKGTVLAYLECSKMEVEICSLADGICVKVNVRDGCIVQARDVLFVIDSSQMSRKAAG